MQITAFLRCCAFALAGVGAAASQAATVWDESANGDLSNDGLSPTEIAVAPGSNQVFGTAGDSGGGIDRDYFRFTVPAGSSLTSIFLLPNTAPSGDVSFIGMQGGPQLTVTPTGGGPGNLLAQGHYGSADIGTDILPVIAIGFTGALPSGTYSVWVQDTGGLATYGLDFALSGVSAVPEPESYALVLAGLGLIGSIAARRR